MTASEEMKVLLDKINLLFNVFSKDGIENISNLEKELLKEQVNKLLMHIDQLGIKASTNNVKTIEEVAKLEEPAESHQEEVLNTEKYKVDESPIANLNEEVLEDYSQEAEVEEVKPQDSEEVKVSIAERFIEQKEAEKKLVTNNKPSRTLQQIIDLNKSFVLKAELFNNDQGAYAEFIDQLNQIDKEEASLAFVEQEAERRNWDKEEKAYELIFRAVEKRFLPLLQQ